MNFSCRALFPIKPRFSLNYFVTDSLWKPFFDYKSPQTSLNLISLTILVTLRPFTMF